MRLIQSLLILVALTGCAAVTKQPVAAAPAVPMTTIKVEELRASYVLTMSVIYYGRGVPTANAVITGDYSSAETCEAAKKTNVAAMKQGEVAMATCTMK